jgi:hypothetical protein
LLGVRRMDDVRSKIAEALEARFGACWTGDTRARLIEALWDSAWRSRRRAGPVFVNNLWRALCSVGLDDAAHAVLEDLIERLALQRTTTRFRPDPPPVYAQK